MVEFSEYDGGKYAKIYFASGECPVTLIVEDPKKQGFGWLKCPASAGSVVLVYKPGVR